MRTKFKKIIFAFLIFCIAALAANSSAAIITIGIEATINSVDDYYNLLEGKVHVGSTITGTYTYDTSTIDTNPISTLGDYLHSAPPCGVVLNLEDLVFSTDFEDVGFFVGIANNHQGNDGYWINSFNNINLYNNVEVDSILWQLDDLSGIALSSTTLPMTAPILSDWDYNTLGIGGGIGGTAPCYDKTFGIYAEVTSAFLIPEPISLFIFGFGLLTIRFRKK